MCMCGQPTVNGQPGYRWNSPSTSIRPISAPDIDENDTLCFDEPGRCGGMDAHSHHYRVVRRYGSTLLLVRHGGGDESMRLSVTATFLAALKEMSSDARYWTLHTIYYAANYAKREAVEKLTGDILRAKVEGRLAFPRRKGTIRLDLHRFTQPRIKAATP